MLLYEIADSLNNEGVDYAVVGGFALALHGIVRATMDVDFVINLRLNDFERAEKALHKIGLISRIPVRAQDVFKGREEFIKNRNMLAWSFVDSLDPFRQADLLIHKDLRKTRTDIISVAGRKIKVATLGEILKMKKEAGRPQDLADVERIEKVLREKKG